MLLCFLNVYMIIQTQLEVFWWYLMVYHKSRWRLLKLPESRRQFERKQRHQAKALHSRQRELVSLMVYELVLIVLSKFFHSNLNYQIRSKICTCHDSSAVVACATFRSDWITIPHSRCRCIFAKCGLQAHKTLWDGSRAWQPAKMAAQCTAELAGNMRFTQPRAHGWHTRLNTESWFPIYQSGFWAWLQTQY